MLENIFFFVRDLNEPQRKDVIVSSDLMVGAWVANDEKPGFPECRLYLVGESTWSKAASHWTGSGGAGKASRKAISIDIH